MIVNRQRRIRVPMQRLESFLTRAQRELRVPPGSLTVCLVKDTEIARWNRAYRHKARPTDVLSFPADTARPKMRRTSSRTGQAPDELNSYLGDIAIAPAEARRNARRFGRSFEDEMRILILHGILHLMGYDHERDSGRMERRERRLRRTLGLA
jgi:probable rRNA maturation factor